MGTHVDGLNHLQVGDRTYNGHRLADIVEEYGTNRLGIDTLPQVVTRGLLLDIAAVRGVDAPRARRGRHPAGRRGGPRRERACRCAPATPSCSTPAGDRCGGSTTTGTAPASRGRGRRWADWLAEQRIALTGCDTWSYGPVPAEDPAEPFVVPQTLNTHHGIVVVENLRLAESRALASREFLLVISHAKLRGATGAWVAPLAIV